MNSNELWRFDFKKTKWQKINSKLTPPGRRSHKAIVYKDKMYMFGGFAEKPMNDFWQFDFETMQWAQLELKGNLPCGRSRFSMTLAEDRL